MGAKTDAETACEFAQYVVNRNPVIILGSGASAAHGVPGMWPLGQMLLTAAVPGVWTSGELTQWDAFKAELAGGADLESALGSIRLTEKQTDFVATETRRFLMPADLAVMSRLFADRRSLPLSRLIRHVFRSAQTAINVVTPNYDRLAEFAADAAEFPFYTGFNPGLFQGRGRGTRQPRRADKTVYVWKVHGSFDWFIDGAQQIVASPVVHDVPSGHTPLMVTPGIDKYRRTHIEPYSSVLANANASLQDGKAYLCVGYGFNDEHLQQKLVERCDRDSVPLVVLTKELTPTARTFLASGRCRSYLALEETPGGTMAYTDWKPGGFELAGVDHWGLNGFLDLVFGSGA
ncbi:hypothetical protein F9K88_22110 [Brucella intermedia]|uniref:SIR2 family protein n=2 Tax=Brucella intermedia TaxID=94625 RepID=A0ABR6AW98_9HYPH|nr:SIR2 family protein [Brucella intermedia]KAB2705938.1 hypothetical protein F9K88_22110 [Brucella intermedia]MBA8853749.1 hypothetical protein [Brucella intermedia]MDH0124232.1 SIR2 family protein [Brucella intermedia GD04153]QNQ42223.1 SIR2 family protein [Brucella intermedia]